MPRTSCVTALLTASLLVAGDTTSATQAQPPAAPPLPPPGVLVDLGGWRLHLNCTGQKRASQPTVVLEAGAGDFSVDWSLVQPGIAAFARVCSYDRAGAGWSELGPRPRTFRQEAWELHALLEKAGERGPFVLVGQSYGAWLVRVYRSAYRDEVAAAVLVDGGVDDPVRIMPDGKAGRSSDLVTGAPVPPVKTAGPLREEEIPSRIVTLIQGQTTESSRRANDPPRDKLPADAQRMRTWSLGQVKHLASNDNPVQAEELAALRAERGRTPAPFEDRPLIVITAGSVPDVEREKVLSDLVSLSRRGKQVRAPRSGHHVTLDEPALVIGIVRDLVSSAR